MRTSLDRHLLHGIPYDNNGSGSGGGGGTPTLAGGAAGGQGGQQGIQQQQIDPFAQQLPQFDNDEDDGLPEDLEDILDAFTPEGTQDPLEVDDVGLQPFKPTPIPQEQVESMNKEVKDAIKAMKFPATAIPADFDPNNREQLGGLLDNVVRAAVTQAMSVVFRPVSMSLGHTIKQLEQSMDSKLQIATQTTGARNVITDMVPEYNMPEYSGLVRSMDEQLKKKGKKPNERAVTLRKMLNTMGVNVKKNGRRQSADSNEDSLPQGTMRTGKTALDSFFAAPLGT